jgi:DnaJ-class molecular chaperone
MGRVMKPKIKERTCPACRGTGFPAVKQPVQAGRRIYPVKCKSCEGKGKITDAE